MRRTDFPDVWSIADGQLLKYPADIAPTWAPGRGRVRSIVAAILFPRAVDSLDMTVARRQRADMGPVLRKSLPDSSYGGGDLAGDLLIQAYQLCGALTDITGQGLSCGLPCGSLPDCTADTVSDRKVFAHFKSRRIRVLDRVAQAGSGGIQIRGRASRDAGCSA
ncbi:hypothetical protein A5685_07770 [Mycobacterium colombiense]|uniref:Uncharacterized protein n=1 Tax=Mycobacterium colombiense TaxID=339268 RepID=A0A1A2RXA1_9MYCO|nr:hypothetical protein A5685_07770 [Mycobacterium colombiense]